MVDGRLLAGAGNKGAAGRQPDDRALAEHHVHRVVQRLPRLGANEPEDVDQAFPEGLVLLPAGEGLGHRVHELDPAVLVGRHHAVADALQRRGQPPLAVLEALLDAVLVERHLDGREQLPLLEGLQHVAERLGDLGALQRVRVGVGGQVDDGDVVAAADLRGSLDAVHFAVQEDVHEHQVRTPPAGLLDRLFPGGRRVGHLVTEVPQPAHQVHCDDVLVLDHQDLYHSITHSLTCSFYLCERYLKPCSPRTIKLHRPFQLAGQHVDQLQAERGCVAEVDARRQPRPVVAHHQDVIAPFPGQTDADFSLPAIPGRRT